MLLFSFRYLSHEIAVHGSAWNGMEYVYVDGVEVARRRNFKKSGRHEFRIAAEGEFVVEFNILLRSGTVEHRLFHQGKLVTEASQPLSVLTKDQPRAMAPIPQNPGTSGAPSRPNVPRGHFVALAGLFFKLFKSAAALKVALAGGTFAGWSVIFNWKVAIILIAVIVFHEYGHLRAMRKFGIPTKGMYLIPFFGGIALGDKAKTHWQEVYISLMGPIYGLFMTLAFLVVYWFTQNHFVGLVASFSALINLFNLLPIYPLDGGHAIKAMVFSAKRYAGFVFLIIGSALAFSVAVKFGLFFISFFIVLGVIDLTFSWREFAQGSQTRMDRYGILFSLVWYLLTVVAFVVIIIIMAETRVPGTEIARIILQS